MYIGKWPPEFRQLPPYYKRVPRSLKGLNPALAILSPIAALVAEKKKKELSGLGDEAAKTPEASAAGASSAATSDTAAIIGVGALVTVLAGIAVGIPAYHGYKRNKSVGWGVWWGLMGILFPAPTIMTAAIQGYGQPLKARGRRR